MSHHSDDTMLIATSDSFWEPNNFKRTTKRIEDGYKLCNDLMALVQERADIEKAYSKSLKGWAKKWNEIIEKGPEYGTTEAAWKGVLVEADRLCELHLKVKDNLVNDAIQQVKTWQKDTYHKSMIQIKERKEMEDAFKKAQKPWAKLLQKVNKAKSDYHTACKQERSASNQERNATGDSSFSMDQGTSSPTPLFPFPKPPFSKQFCSCSYYKRVKKMPDDQRVQGMKVPLKQKTKEEVQKCKERYELALQELNTYNPKYMEDMAVVLQVKKMQDRVQKTKEEVQKCKERYELALQELNAYNPKYMEDMSVVFEKCQEMEAQRLQFFKETLFSIHKCLNISQDPDLPQIYEEFYHTINNADHEKDLKWWSNNHGVNMAMNWPQFEDYTEEFREIAKGKSKEALPAGSITLINQRPVGEDLHEFPPVNHKSSTKKAAPVSSQVTGSRVISTDASDTKKTDKTDNNGTTPAITNGNGTTGSREGNPFEEEEWDEEAGDALVDNGEPGVPVKALYDYEGAESDELSFKQGDVFEKLEDEDEQGWCKGRKDGRVGLYPANYVEVVQ